MEGIRLADAIEMLRSEILEAQTRATGARVQFPIQSLKVDLKVGLTKLADGKAGFTVPFIGAELGVSGGLHSETTQIVSVLLGPPVDPQGRPVSVGQTSDELKG
jgi:Trypsin-co-occurring domain 2